MRLTRRALIASTAAAAATGIVASLASADRTVPRGTLPTGLWRSRTTADLLAVDRSACRTYTRYDTMMALVDESPRDGIEKELIEARLETDPGRGDRLELEYWGTVTRFVYDREADWPAMRRLGGDDWISDPSRTVDAFFKAVSGHFAFAPEAGIDWTDLRAETDAALRRGSSEPGALFDALAAALRRLEDGHGSLRGMGRYAASRDGPDRFYQSWKAAGGNPVGGDYSDGFSRDWLHHVSDRVLAGAGHRAARDTVAWGRLRSGLGYIALMACEGLSHDEGGQADVAAARQVFDRVMRDLADTRGIVVDMRYNYGGWDRVPLSLAAHFTDRPLPAFTKQPVRRGIGLDVQTIGIVPAAGPRHAGPLAVLTSDATISAAEVGTIGFRALPNVRTFGTATYGALSDPFYFRLPNGWRGAVSNEIYRASDGRVYEGTGIPPDRPSAAPSASDFREVVDSQLRDAEAWLLSL
ncbi:S41 family peptidase (plasmid) [Skermanella mucosa]|uniref:S41 family peptidase n=1 Tax=Skermanella mucosa TaxID=1789672 RepID=UPI00192A731A|nr:S41 family peptidase [Skermanella mucosa]UEM24900.1 S41 family peptidase [Skermanella mucosa]